MNKIKDIRRLTRLARKLWASLVKLEWGGVCASCGSRKYLNAHHIESYKMNKALRFDPKNSVLLCAKCHKFGYPAAHTSWIMLYDLLYGTERIHYLREHYNKDKQPEITVQYLESVIKNLKERIQHVEENSKNHSN